MKNEQALYFTWKGKITRRVKQKLCNKVSFVTNDLRPVRDNMLVCGLQFNQTNHLESQVKRGKLKLTELLFMSNLEGKN